MTMDGSMKIEYTFDVFDRMPNRILVLYRKDEFVPFANIHLASQEELDFWRNQILEWNAASQKSTD